MGTESGSAAESDRECILICRLRNLNNPMEDRLLQNNRCESNSEVAKVELCISSMSIGREYKTRNVRTGVQVTQEHVAENPKA